MNDDNSIEDGKAFIQEWLARLSPQERAAIDASFRECLPKLRQIETTRLALRDRSDTELPVNGFERVLSSIDEVEDFEFLVHTVGIDPENLTAGEVVAIALQWASQQEVEIDQEKVIRRIQGVRSQASRQTALDNLPNDAMMNHIDIAVALDLPAESIRNRLERWRLSNSAGWQDIPDASTNETRFVYRIEAIRAVLLEAIVASYRLPKKL